MQPLNYCRDMTRQFRERLSVPSFAKHALAPSFMECVTLAAVAQKFMLPQGGRVLNDDQLLALSPDVPLQLPYDCIAIESVAAVQPSAGGDLLARKFVMLAHQVDDLISVKPVFHAHATGQWTPMPWIGIERTLRSIDVGDMQYPQVRWSMYSTEPRYGLEETDYDNFVAVLLHLLNALACHNVFTERIGGNRRAGAVKSALSFDEYHVLMVRPSRTQAGCVSAAAASRRSPREHLRRGHVRRINGRSIWINDVVVAAGRRAGVITKDYAIGNAAP